MKKAKLAVTIKARLKEIRSKSLVSGDKGLSLTFEMDNPAPEVLDTLNRLHDPQAEVNVGVWK